MNMEIHEFIRQLSSKAPVPGGGGASALIGAIGVSLCSMVANLTSGKKKYAEYQQDIEEILEVSQASISRLLALIEKDAEVFEPLSAAYGIPKEDPNREAVMEKALVTACSVPMEILKEVSGILDVIVQLTVKGSKLAVSDVGVAASACRSAMESAVLNIYINTKLMKDREYALKTNIEAQEILNSGVKTCDEIYRKISDELKG
ncbi:MAG: cyclodeaminase/cyclohydrolase family protein [Thermoclostridium sp.]|nr:cyclodeaminase/cyclohydrolase family protein [Thermoclostridium sp.]